MILHIANLYLLVSSLCILGIHKGISRAMGHTFIPCLSAIPPKSHLPSHGAYLHPMFLSHSHCGGIYHHAGLTHCLVDTNPRQPRYSRSLSVLEGTTPSSNNSIKINMNALRRPPSSNIHKIYCLWLVLHLKMPGEY